MSIELTLDEALATLSSAPTSECRLRLFGGSATARIAIPQYKQKVSDHYRQAYGDNYAKVSVVADPEKDFTHFGLILSFDAETVLPVYDAEHHLEDSLRSALTKFGPLLIRNALIGEGEDQTENLLQKNIFPDLSFHVDRGSQMENQFSLFTRDPRDPLQTKPRDTSTLFMTRRATCYQVALEGKSVEDFVHCSNVILFEEKMVEVVLGDVVLEQSWQAEEGVGEIGIIDNRTVFHASYHRKKRGYAIGTRYLF